MTGLPLKHAMNPSSASAIAIRGAAKHFMTLPNGHTDTIEGLLSILVLAAQEVTEKKPNPDIVAAKVQLSKLGFPGHNLNLSGSDKLAMYLLWLYRAPRREEQASPDMSAIAALRGGLNDLRRDPRSATQSIWSRAQKLWKRVETMRADHKVIEKQIEARLAPLLPEGLKLGDHQLEMVRAIEAANYHFILTDTMGIGKMQPETALCLTPGGWKRFGDLAVGDKVIDPDGGSAEITGVFPHGTKEIYRVTLSDGTSTECGKEHLWHVYTAEERHKGAPGRVMSLGQIMDKGIKATRHRKGVPEEHRKWFLPIAKPIEYVPNRLPRPLRPYPLGVILGDGRVKMDDLRGLGLFGLGSIEKFIPPGYMNAPIDVRKALLRGLMDTNGDCTKNSTCIFNTSSSQLRDGVIDLVRGLGGISNFTTRLKPKYRHKGEVRAGKMAYRVNVRTPFNPFTLARKAERWKMPILARGIEKVELAGQARCLCISVSSKRQLYITDDYIVTHNTIEAIGALLLLGKDAFPMVIACPLSVTYNWQKEIEKWMAKFSPVVHQLRSHTCGKEGKKPCRVCRLMDTDGAADIEAGHNVVFIGSWQQMITHHRGLIAFQPKAVVGDELHYISNHKAQRTRAFLRIRAHARAVLGLTGTLEPHGRHREAYAQIKAVAPDAFRHLVTRAPRDGIPASDWKPYARRYCGPVSMELEKLKPRRGQKKDEVRRRKVTSYNGRSNDVEFGWMLSKYTLRRTKAEVFGEDGLPAKARYKIDIEVTTAIQLKIAKMRDAVRAKVLAKATEIEVELRERGAGEEAIAKKVKQATGAHAVMELSAMRMLVGHLKIPWAINRLKEQLEEGDDVIVFCDHNDVADALLEKARKNFGDKAVLRGRGSMNGPTRGKLVEKAQTDKDVRLIILTRAFHAGITLTKFNRVIMLQRWWAPGEEEQAEDRAHRIGQERDVGIDYPVIAGTCDEAMGKLAVWKETGQQTVQGTAQIRAYEWIMEHA